MAAMEPGERTDSVSFEDGTTYVWPGVAAGQMSIARDLAVADAAGTHGRVREYGSAPEVTSTPATTWPTTNWIVQEVR